jgi:transcriptional regulator GlxA family with amidase domain
MAASRTSAVDDQEPINVLFALQDKFDLLDFAGPIQALTYAAHDFQNRENTRAFEVTVAAAEPKVISEQGIVIDAHITFAEAHERLEDFHVLVVVGGESAKVLEKEAEPLGIINDFSELQKKDPANERTIFSVCTGALFLAHENILSGLSATTHPDFITKFENVCSDAAQRNLTERTDVIEDARYVVNNLRFDLGDEDENPYIRRKSDTGRRPSNARKGSMSFKGSLTRRESIARRAAMRLGGLRVITAGGNSSGIDAALYLVSAMVDDATAAEVAREMQWTWTKGVVVDGLDV